MTLKLVPDAEAPPALDQMDGEQLRAHFNTLHTERLDFIRANVRTMKTSEIIALLANPMIVAHNVCDETNPNEDHDAVTVAATIALADELDRRVPVPS
jgi:hypothetical protein